MSTNEFGGKNKRSVYIPMSETELEVIARLVDSKDLKVVIHGWGEIESPTVKYGDKNLHIPIKMTFNKPVESFVDVYFFDMELRTGSGLCLFKKRMSTAYNGQPLKVMAGLVLDMVWDISIRHLDPNLVRTVKPGARGLTSKLQDNLTLDFTATGNMKLDKQQAEKARQIQKAEEIIKKMDLEKLNKNPS